MVTIEASVTITTDSADEYSQIAANVLSNPNLSNPQLDEENKTIIVDYSTA